MSMTGAEMRDLRKAAGLTQAELADQVGLSRKSINEAEALGDRFVERRTEIAVRAITITAKVRAQLVSEAEHHRMAGDSESADLLKQAAILLTGNFATDERTLYKLALTAASLRREVEQHISRSAAPAPVQRT